MIDTLNQNNITPNFLEFDSAVLNIEKTMVVSNLPDGQPILISGQSERLKRSINHYGEKYYQAKSANTLVICEILLHRFNIPVDKIELENHAALVGISELICKTGFINVMSFDSLRQLMAEYQISSHIEKYQSFEDLAHHLEIGVDVIIAVNSSLLWKQPVDIQFCEYDSIVIVTAVIRDAYDESIIGFYVADVASVNCDCFIDFITFQNAWLETGGWGLILDEHENY